MLTKQQVLQVIDERDAAKQALSQAFYLVTGRSPKWSNIFGHAEALEEIEDTISLFREHARDAERWRVLRANQQQETSPSSGPASAIPKVLIIRLNAEGCAKFFESGAPDYAATLDAILDAEISERGS